MLDHCSIRVADYDRSRRKEKRAERETTAFNGTDVIWEFFRAHSK